MRDAMAGPWVDDQAGHGFVQLSYSRYSADHYFSGPGESAGSTDLKQGTLRHITIPLSPPNSFAPEAVNSKYLAQDVLFYGEVSLSHGFGVVASMPLVRYISEDIAVMFFCNALAAQHR